MIRVRFAPSPTGYLHIGGVRTALFNYLYARAQGGQFLLRIEDTDRERSTPEFERNILESMAWLGLESDETLVYQSRRLERYKEVARELVEKNLAVEEEREGKTAVRFLMPEKPAVFHDLVHGETSFDASLFDDLVIMKSDGYPTYQLACVVDDHDMQISHVIRGDDHISNTPRQILLFEALGWKPPKYAHLPLILGGDGTPLSKRHGAVALSHYREEGYLPEALLNYLALLGWGPEGNQEVFTLAEMTQKFSLKRITKSNARFDLTKLEWMNSQHIKKLAPEDYCGKLAQALPAEAASMAPEKWRSLALLFQTRIKTLRGLRQEAGYCFAPLDVYDGGKLQECLAKAGLEGADGRTRLAEYLSVWITGAEKLPAFQEAPALEQWTRQTAEMLKIHAKTFIHPLRFAWTGELVSPGLFELAVILGKDVCLERARKLAGQLKTS